MADSYDQAFNHQTIALRRCSEAQITREDILPPLIDFLAATGLIMGGEPAVRAAKTRLENRIADWQAGRFPKQAAANDEGAS